MAITSHPSILIRKLSEFFLNTITLLFKLCFLQGTPADLPFSKKWLSGVLALNILLHVIFSNRENVDLGIFILMTVSAYILLIGSIYLLLRMRRLEIRFYKCLMAYVGVEIFFVGLLYLIVKVSPQIIEQPLFLIVFALWNMLVKANILKFSLNSKMPMGILLTFNVEIIRNIPFIVYYFPLMMQQGGA